jgi:hypothetical protein
MFDHSAARRFTMMRDVAARRLWVVRGDRGGQMASVVVEASSQWEAAYLGAGLGLRIVVLHDAVPLDARGGSGGAASAFFAPGASPRRQTAAPLQAGQAFGRPVTAAQRGVFMAAGVAVALVNWWLPWAPH